MPPIPMKLRSIEIIKQKFDRNKNMIQQTIHYHEDEDIYSSDKPVVGFTSYGSRKRQKTKKRKVQSKYPKRRTRKSDD